MRLKHKIAVITGAGSGFGEGIARLFATEGAKVAIVDLNAEAAQRVADEIGEQAIAITADVSNGKDMDNVVKTTCKHWGGIDILVNNAGFTYANQPMLEVTEETFDRVFSVNVKSIYLAAKAVVPVMRQKCDGVILNIASTAGVRPRPGLTWYNGSKGAVITLTKSMAVELAEENIRVSALNPVAGETGMLHLFMGEDTIEKREQFCSSIPLGRLSTPQDIANAALFLCSDEASFLTGVCLNVDGGRCV
ncbi:SDR family oxidoreductase [Vibrio nigripulchritudo]|uniref:Putative 3-oxoacyl-[acyl-carrier-protein] reductase (3-ketoacyl-acyl carrier protein reductase) n=1 Tax=Vibrio nigripulchritudo TaxID=28173 RepID=U4JW55_9VIBR|nr:SDR family oxidoreductase [Vibrio nigripulchritudo]CCO57115.1 Putative 3-oxoacyl-[acyl-carrier-protein] reductase (3-ketoacyl-acyl carrier protein reductase) [Vibrio nigripulchritudo]